MNGFTVKKINELSHYQGPEEMKDVKFRYAAKDLGVSAWGMNVLEMNATWADYPDHDHMADGQEEVYVVIRGSVTLRINGKDTLLEVGAMARVGPEVKRKLIPGSQGATVLAIGGTPGK